MPDPELVATLRAATQRLVRTVDALDDEGWRAASLLPRWTRAHVVAHLTLNAEALGAALHGVAAGTPVPMYADQAARDGDIELLVDSGTDELRERLLASTTVFAAAVDALPDHLGPREVERVPGGPRFPAGAAANMRLREVEIHHADLGLDYDHRDWTPDFAALLLDGRAALSTDSPGMVLAADDLDRRWSFGDVPADGAVVRGPVRALAWWATGRPAGPDLTCDNGELPRMETW